MNDNAPEGPRAIETEAITWFVTMRGETASEQSAAFRAWIDQSERHRNAYLRAKHHFDGAAVLKQSHRFASSDQPGWKGWASPEWLRAAAAFLAVVVTGALLFKLSRGHPDTGPRGPVFYQTGHGEIRAIALDDGLRVTLDSDSRLSVSNGRTSQHIALEAGKARFHMAANARPIEVEAGAGVIVPTAATFDVAFERDQEVAVTLLAGSARVQGKMVPAVLQMQRRKLFDAPSLSYPISQFRPVGRSGAGLNWSDWPQGWVESRSISLARLVTEANRYAAEPIQIDDPAINDLRVTGRFRVTNINGFISRICELFDLAADRRRDGLHLRSKLKSS